VPDSTDNDFDQDVAMSTEVEGTDPTEPSALTSDRVQTSSTRVAQKPSSSQPGATLVDTVAPAQPKKRMIITHDMYITLRSMIVLHLTHVERDTGRGIDRDELIDWYLELKEETMQDVEEIEYHKELVTKMLRKLVKVSTDLAPNWIALTLTRKTT
jgi:DNA replication licensing factor MCM6